MVIGIPIVKYDINYVNKLKAEVLTKPEIPNSFFRYQCLQNVILLRSKVFEVDVSTQIFSRNCEMSCYVIVYFLAEKDGN
jgi:hypothetical protein